MEEELKLTEDQEKILETSPDAFLRLEGRSSSFQKEAVTLYISKEIVKELQKLAASGVEIELWGQAVSAKYDGWGWRSDEFLSYRGRTLDFTPTDSGGSILKEAEERANLELEEVRRLFEGKGYEPVVRLLPSVLKEGGVNLACVRR